MQLLALRKLPGTDLGHRDHSPHRLRSIALLEPPRLPQAALRSDIGLLKTGLEFFDIALVPIIVAAVAIVLGALRLRRRGTIALET